jgi:hypothetical protein
LLGDHGSGQAITHDVRRRSAHVKKLIDSDNQKQTSLWQMK